MDNEEDEKYDRNNLIELMLKNNISLREANDIADDWELQLDKDE